MARSEDSVYSTRITDDESPTGAFFSERNHCCFQLPCFGSHPTARATRLNGGSSSTAAAVGRPSLWQRIRIAEIEGRWWALPITALKKLREWSEIVAGPRWKTFIRRFRRNWGGVCPGGVIGGRGAPRHVNFQYDPLSYSLNFDEGQRGQVDEDFGLYPDFTSRYVSGASQSAKHSTDLGRVAATPASGY